MHRFICCENSVNEPYLFDVISGDYYLLSGSKTVVKQDVYSEIDDYGFTVYNTISGNNITIPYKTDGTKI